MNIFLFNKPRQTIRNILFFIALVSIFLTALAISSSILWKYYPESVSKIDMMIPDYYGDNLNRLYRKAQKKKDYKKQIKYYEKLYDELIECSTLNKYYKYRQKSASFLIDHYLENNQYPKARKIAALWEKMYPNDFHGKFKYAEVLEYNNRHDALMYYATLYKNYDDIPDVIYKYINLLRKEKNIKLATELKLEADRLVKKQVEFKIYYQDNKKFFTEGQTLVVGTLDYLNEGDRYTFNLEKTFHKFHGFRLDIENTPLSFNINHLKVLLNNHKMKEELEVANIHHMTKENDTYHISGDDPHFVFIIPKQFLDTKKNLEFTVSMSLENNE